MKMHLIWFSTLTLTFLCYNRVLLISYLLVNHELSVKAKKAFFEAALLTEMPDHAAHLAYQLTLKGKQHRNNNTSTDCSYTNELGDGRYNRF